ncbi:uncharacterized protein [Oscarella lobularis]|uniref:uncharacterized protein n=1 Tax=Oscarella lobularis TaxID=121494 RepID=UPI00331425E1
MNVRFAALLSLLFVIESTISQSPILETTLGSTSIYAEWNAGTLNSSLVKSYRLALRLAATARLVDAINATTPGDALLDGLAPESRYIVDVEARDGDDRVLGRVERIVGTRALGPSASLTRPTKLSALSIDETSVELEWTVGTIEGILRFLVEYDLDEDFIGYHVVKVEPPTKAVSTLKIDGLTPGKTYVFRVVSVRMFSQQTGDKLYVPTVEGDGSDDHVPIGYPIGIGVLAGLLLLTLILWATWCLKWVLCVGRRKERNNPVASTATDDVPLQDTSKAEIA